MKPYHCLRQLPSRGVANYFLNISKPVPAVRRYALLSHRKLQQASASCIKNSQHASTDSLTFVNAENYSVDNDSDKRSRGKGDPFDPHSALKMDPAMRSQRMEHKLFMLDNDIRRFNRVDPLILESYLALLEPEDEISSPVALTLLKCCGHHMPMYPNAKKVEILHKVWSTLKEHNFRFDISHYNSLLLLYLESDYAFSPIEILARLEKEGIEPNRGYIGAYEDMPLTEYICNSLLFANVKTKNDQEFKSVLDFMQKNGIELTAESYMDMMCAYAENKDIENVEKILNEQTEVIFTDTNILHLVYKFVKHGRPDCANRLLIRLLKTPGYVHEALNAALSINSLGEYAQALEVLDTIHRGVQRPGDQVEFGGAILLQAIDLNFSEDKILHMCELMCQKEINNHALDVAYIVAAERSKKGLATFLMKAMVGKSDDNSEAKVPLRQQCFWPLMLMNARRGDIAGLASATEFMRRSGFTADKQGLELWVWPYLAPGKSNEELITMVRGRLHDISLFNAATALFIYRLKRGELEMARQLINNCDLLALDSYTDRKLIDFLRSGRVDANLIAELYRGVIDTQFGTRSKTLVSVDVFLVRCGYDLPEDLATGVVDAFLEKRIAASPEILRRTANMRLYQSQEIQEKFKQMVDIGFTLSPAGSTAQLGQIELDKQPDIDHMTDAELSDYTRKVNLETLRLHTHALARSQNVSGLLRLHTSMEANRRNASCGVYYTVSRAFYKAGDLDNAVKFLLLTMRRKTETFVPNSLHLLNIFVALTSERRWVELRSCAQTLFDCADSSPPTAPSLSNVSDAFQDDDGFPVDARVKSGFLDQSCEYLMENLLQKLFEPFISTPHTRNSSTSSPSDIEDREATVLSVLEVLVKHRPFGLSRKHLGYIVDKLVANKHVNLAKRVFGILFQYTQQVVKPSQVMQGLAAADDIDGLQKVYDMSAVRLGDNKAALKLAVALASVGRLRDAMKILSIYSYKVGERWLDIQYWSDIRQAPNMHLPPGTLRAEADGLSESRNFVGLEALVRMTKGKFGEVRERLITQLLTLYRSRHMLDSALNLWTILQEENYTPSVAILDLLSVICKENNHKWPLAETVAADRSVSTSTNTLALLEKLKSQQVDVKGGRKDTAASNMEVESSG